MEGEIMFRAIAQRFPMMTLAHDRTHWRDTPVFRGGQKPSRSARTKPNPELHSGSDPIRDRGDLPLRDLARRPESHARQGIEPAQSLQLNKHSQTTNCPFGKSNTPTLLPLERRAP